MADKKNKHKKENQENVKEPAVEKQAQETQQPTEDVEKANDKKEKKTTEKSENPEKKIEELQTELETLKDKYIRLQAEFDNFRKRTLQDKAQLIKTAGESIILNILPVVDDFERALEAMKDVPDDDPGKQGTVLIYNKFVDFLKQNNVKEIEAKNTDFNVDLHEAVTKFPAPSEELKGKVIDVVQKGYTLNDKVIRFAKVVVGE